MSTITVTGNLAADPELRFIPNGTAVAEFVVIENRRKRDESGEWVDDEPNRFTVKVWRQTAENVAESLTRGDAVTVTGHVKTDKWADKETGDNRYRQHIEADEVSVPLRFQTVRISKVTRTREPAEN